MGSYHAQGGPKIPRLSLKHYRVHKGSLRYTFLQQSFVSELSTPVTQAVMFVDEAGERVGAMSHRGFVHNIPTVAASLAAGVT
jgi:hypothetical protein